MKGTKELQAAAVQFRKGEITAKELQTEFTSFLNVKGKNQNQRARIAARIINSLKVGNEKLHRTYSRTIAAEAIVAAQSTDTTETE